MATPIKSPLSDAIRENYVKYSEPTSIRCNYNQAEVSDYTLHSTDLSFSDDETDIRDDHDLLSYWTDISAHVSDDSDNSDEASIVSKYTGIQTDQRGFTKHGNKIESGIPNKMCPPHRETVISEHSNTQNQQDSSDDIITSGMVKALQQFGRQQWLEAISPAKFHMSAAKAANDSLERHLQQHIESTQSPGYSGSTQDLARKCNNNFARSLNQRAKERTMSRVIAATMLLATVPPVPSEKTQLSALEASQLRAIQQLRLILPLFAYDLEHTLRSLRIIHMEVCECSPLGMKQTARYRTNPHATMFASHAKQVSAEQISKLLDKLGRKIPSGCRCRLRQCLSLIAENVFHSLDTQKILTILNEAGAQLYEDDDRSSVASSVCSTVHTSTSVPGKSMTPRSPAPKSAQWTNSFRSRIRGQLWSPCINLIDEVERSSVAKRADEVFVKTANVLLRRIIRAASYKARLRSEKECDTPSNVGVPDHRISDLDLAVSMPLEGEDKLLVLVSFYMRHIMRLFDRLRGISLHDKAKTTIANLLSGHKMWPICKHSIGSAAAVFSEAFDVLYNPNAWLDCSIEQLLRESRTSHQPANRSRAGSSVSNTSQDQPPGTISFHRSVSSGALSQTPHASQRRTQAPIRHAVFASQYARRQQPPVRKKNNPPARRFSANVRLFGNSFQRAPSGTRSVVGQSKSQDHRETRRHSYTSLVKPGGQIHRTPSFATVTSTDAPSAVAEGLTQFFHPALVNMPFGTAQNFDRPSIRSFTKQLLSSVGYDVNIFVDSLVKRLMDRYPLAPDSELNSPSKVLFSPNYTVSPSSSVHRNPLEECYLVRIPMKLFAQVQSVQHNDKNVTPVNSNGHVPLHSLPDPPTPLYDHVTDQLTAYSMVCRTESKLSILPSPCALSDQFSPAISQQEKFTPNNITCANDMIHVQQMTSKSPISTPHEITIRKTINSPSRRLTTVDRMLAELELPSVSRSYDSHNLSSKHSSLYSSPVSKQLFHSSDNNDDMNVPEIKTAALIEKLKSATPDKLVYMTRDAYDMLQHSGVNVKRVGSIHRQRDINDLPGEQLADLCTDIAQDQTLSSLSDNTPNTSDCSDIVICLRKLNQNTATGLTNLSQLEMLSTAAYAHQQHFQHHLTHTPDRHPVAAPLTEAYMREAHEQHRIHRLSERKRIMEAFRTRMWSNLKFVILEIVLCHAHKTLYTLCQMSSQEACAEFRVCLSRLNKQLTVATLSVNKYLSQSFAPIFKSTTEISDSRERTVLETFDCVIALLKSMELRKTPFELCHAAVGAMQALADIPQKYFHTQLTNGELDEEDVEVAADAMLPLLTLAIVKANIYDLPALLAYLDHFLPESLQAGEEGYAVVVLHSVHQHSLHLVYNEQ